MIACFSIRCLRTAIFAGTAPGLAAQALIPSPAEPRLFVCSRDGTAQEILQTQAANRAVQTLDADSNTAADSRPAKQPLTWYAPELCQQRHTYHTRCSAPLPCGDGLFAAVSGSAHTSTAAYADTALPEAAKVHAKLPPGAGGDPCAVNPQVWVRSVFEDRHALSSEHVTEVTSALAVYANWTKEVQAATVKYAVKDSRSAAEIEQETMVKGLVRKAYKVAKALKRKEKEKARAAAAGDAAVSATFIMCQTY